MFSTPIQSGISPNWSAVFDWNDRFSPQSEQVRLRVHTETHIVAEPRGIVLRQDGQDTVIGIRVDSKQELIDRAYAYMDEINKDPVV